MWSETSANYQKCYTITVGDRVFKLSLSDYMITTRCTSHTNFWPLPPICLWVYLL